MLADVERVRALLESRGILPSEPRVEIGRILFAGPRHLTAEQVQGALAERGLRVSKATVYNTLNLYAARGLLRCLNVDPSRASFDSNTAPHFHMVDLDTGELVDVPPEAVEFARLPPLPPGTEAAGIELVIRVRRRGGGLPG